MKKLLRKISYIPIYAKLYCGLLKLILIRLIVGHPQADSNKWLILERGNDAQDNAWHFFKYMVANHPEIDARFAIRKDSPDFKRNLSEYKDKVLEYDSREYYRFLFNSSVIISTHLKTWTPDVAITGRFQNTSLRYKGKIVFLQHGITRQEMPGLKYPKQHIDLFISGAKNEYDLIRRTLYYPEGIIRYTGLARFDNLLDCKTKKQILIMPTWRAKYANLSADDFMTTDFYKYYACILGNTSLLSLLRNSGYKLLFYNHYEFQKYNPCFEKFSNDVVSIVKFGTISVQDLLKESALVVTDYSSIYYDVLYMHKPVIFFQFDKESFDSTQYGKNYDDVSEFGFLTFSTDEVSNTITQLIEHNCQIPNVYIEKSDKIFLYRDKNNCRRIYRAVSNLIKPNYV